MRETTTILISIVVFHLISLSLAQSYLTFDDGCNNTVRIRRNWKTLSPKDQSNYVSAVIGLKKRTVSPVYNDFVKIHNDAAGYAHYTSWFLPWHRFFLYRYESALRWVAKNDLKMSQADVCSIAAHYWESEGAYENINPAPFRTETFGSWNSSNNGTFRCNITDGLFNASWFKTSAMLSGCSKAVLARRMNSSISLVSQTTVISLFRSSSNNVFGDSTRGFARSIEGSPHAGPHSLIGGHMTTMISPDEPAFYLHHSNVDRWWYIWSDMRDIDLLTDSSQLNSSHYQKFGTDTSVGGIDDCIRYMSLVPGLFATNTSDCPTPRKLIIMGKGPAWLGMNYKYETPDSIVNLISNTLYPGVYKFGLFSTVKKRGKDKSNKRYGEFDDDITHRGWKLKKQQDPKRKADDILQELENDECVRYSKQTYASEEWLAMAPAAVKADEWWIPSCKKGKGKAQAQAQAKVDKKDKSKGKAKDEDEDQDMDMDEEVRDYDQDSDD